ncbi:hypothetical protein [Paenibacillus sp. NEAU-GSW1]|uniref:hypothetical protein n=1 Tax=Paenibacillus sp. NEAU-GSW1 TaxID=2682486 RepID=UPI0012E1FC0E|nr:hypothetical protein [Paenibacillus sp. NEAU-GSW1]MUT66768.1 hypothetical protein [Paenibacillus sp. NEAU-GSW1]
MTSGRDLPPNHLTDSRIHRILDTNHPLCREDVVWMLEYIKKKVADEDPALAELSQPRLLKSFHCFAEAAMSLVHRRHCSAQEASRLRGWLSEAAFGLTSQPPKLGGQRRIGD